MKKSRFCEQQIAFMLKQAADGIGVEEEKVKDQNAEKSRAGSFLFSVVLACLFIFSLFVVFDSESRADEARETVLDRLESSYDGMRSRAEGDAGILKELESVYKAGRKKVSMQSGARAIQAGFETEKRMREVLNK